MGHDQDCPWDPPGSTNCTCKKRSKRAWKICVEVSVIAETQKEALDSVDHALMTGMPEGTLGRHYVLTGEKPVSEEKTEEEVRLEKSRQDREDRKVTAFAVGSFEFSVRLRRGFSGQENMAEFLRIGKRDTKERVVELLRDPEFQNLLHKYDIHMKLIKISPSVTATFETED